MDIHPIKKTQCIFWIVIYNRLIIQQFYSSKIHGFDHVLHPHWILTGYGIWFILVPTLWGSQKPITQPTTWFRVSKILSNWFRNRLRRCLPWRRLWRSLSRRCFRSDGGTLFGLGGGPLLLPTFGPIAFGVPVGFGGNSSGTITFEASVGVENADPEPSLLGEAPDIRKWSANPPSSLNGGCLRMVSKFFKPHILSVPKVPCQEVWSLSVTDSATCFSRTPRRAPLPYENSTPSRGQVRQNFSRILPPFFR